VVEFFQSNREIVFFIYGQAFFILGLAVALRSRQRSQIAFAKHLWLLAAFGIVHGVYEWGIIFIPIQQTYLAPDTINLLRLIELLLETLSFFALFQFGVELTAPRLRLAPTALLLIWCAALLALQIFVQPDLTRFRIIGDTLARYLLGAPGAALAAWGLHRQARQAAQIASPRIARYFEIAALAFALYALVASVVPRSDFFPASIWNYDVLLATIGVPAAIFRAACGIVIAAAIIRGLDIFDVETERQLDDAARTRAVAADRERIGRELHDGIIQSLYGAGLTLEDAALTIDEDAARARQKIASAIDALNRTIRDIRAYILDLRAEATPTDWTTRLADIVRLFRVQTLIDAELKIEGAPRKSLDKTRCSELLAIVREALINARKHARASHVEIRVRYHPTELELAVSDNGVGFAPETMLRDLGARQGLRNMRERAHLIGGRLEIDSALGRGATIRVLVPCDKD